MTTTIPTMPAKDPNANLDYMFDWTEWLGSDSIVSATVTASPGISIGTTVVTTTGILVWVSGGTTGISYSVTCEITTLATRIDERSMTIPVQSR